MEVDIFCLGVDRTQEGEDNLEKSYDEFQLRLKLRIELIEGL